MSRIGALWAQSSIPDGYGLYTSEQFFPVDLEEDETYGFGPAQAVDEIEGEAVDVTVSAENERYAVFAGETSWESDGFMVLVDKTADAVLWILHLPEMETPESLALTSESVQCRTHCYPVSRRIEVPIHRPHLMTATHDHSC